MQRLAGLFMAETCTSLVHVESMIRPIWKSGSGDNSCQLDDLLNFFKLVLFKLVFLVLDAILVELFVATLMLDTTDS